MKQFPTTHTNSRLGTNPSLDRPTPNFNCGLKAEPFRSRWSLARGQTDNLITVSWG